MANYRDAQLYLRSLSADIDDDHRAERQRLREALGRLRDRAARLAGHIAVDLPGFTGHDVEHLDALWTTADAVAGPRFDLNPLEAFVFGAAALLHDLGLTVAAYLDGPADLEGDEAWQEALSIATSWDVGTRANGGDVSPSPTAIQRAREMVLRKRHAARAGELATNALNGPEGPVYLIEDEDLRLDLGWLIGKIAASHGSDASTLPAQFGGLLPTPKDFPSQWQIDSLVLACLLRCADAAQLDGRRARALQQAIQRPEGDSLNHWNFQRQLHPARLEDDRLIFESTRPFPREMADAWWLGYDWLRLASDELRTADAILAEERPSRRFAARSVAATDAPARLAERVQTQGWLPIDARIHVSNVADLARKLGGRQLYGSTQAVPLRELLQNGMDAVRARQALSDDEARHEVTVTLSKEGGEIILEVRDTGVGMSPAVLTGPLLDFGNSLWRSDSLGGHLPDLAARGFQSYGRFGIGFFAAFIWSDRVQVTSRSYLAGPPDTYTLNFTNLRARPLLRRADRDERLDEPGTVVRLTLDHLTRGKRAEGGEAARAPKDIAKLIPWLAPAAEVDIHLKKGETKPRRVVRAGDWRSGKPLTLLRRLQPEEPVVNPDELALLAENMRAIKMGERVVGRATIIPWWRPRDALGALVGGGLRVRGCRGLAGVLLADNLNLARTEARPIASQQALREWAHEQAQILSSSRSRGTFTLDCARTIAACGAHPGELPVCETSDGNLSLAQVEEWAAGRRKARLLNLYEAKDISDIDIERFYPVDGVIVVEPHIDALDWFDRAPSEGKRVTGLELRALVIQALQNAWGAVDVSGHVPMAVVGEGDSGKVKSLYYTLVRRGRTRRR
jgi:hypothetical protein